MCGTTIGTEHNEAFHVTGTASRSFSRQTLLAIQHRYGASHLDVVRDDVLQHYPRSGSPRIPYITSPNASRVAGTTIASSVKKIAA
jgi:hypothetical protein